MLLAVVLLVIPLVLMAQAGWAVGVQASIAAAPGIQALQIPEAVAEVADKQLAEAQAVLV
jgi:hypothetical protein